MDPICDEDMQAIVTTTAAPTASTTRQRTTLAAEIITWRSIAWWTAKHRDHSVRRRHVILGDRYSLCSGARPLARFAGRHGNEEEVEGGRDEG